MRTFVAFLIGIGITIVAGFIIGWWWIYGSYDVAASRGRAFPDGIFARITDRSIGRNAPKRQNPVGANPQAIAEGLREYKDDCLRCHGAPGVAADDFAKGMWPPPPDLSKQGTQSMTDGELFWVVTHGIRSTGMPAFEKVGNDTERWKVIAFLRQLPSLTDEQYRELHAPETGGDEEKQQTGGHEPPKEQPLQQQQQKQQGGRPD